jgi:hypothetical protein
MFYLDGFHICVESFKAGRSRCGNLAISRMAVVLNVDASYNFLVDKLFGSVVNGRHLQWITS